MELLITGILQDIVSNLHTKYPQLKINSVPTITGSLWVVVHRQDMTVYSPDRPPVYDPHLTLTMADGQVTYDFRAHSQTIEKGVFSWEAIECHLNTLKSYSG